MRGVLRGGFRKMVSQNRSFASGSAFATEVAGGRPTPHYFRWAIIYGLVAAALFGVFLTLPYKSSLLTSVSLEQVLSPPGSGFQIGSVRWDLRAYATDPHLEPLRQYFRSVAGNKTGVAAATAISKDFVTRFPFGNAPRECFSRSYDPAEDLEEHLRGAPGHCVTRSSLASAVLLSVGIPARMVQLSTNTAVGHNTFEVWDKRDGWVMVDPTYGGLFKMGDNLCSAVEAQLYGGAASWTQIVPPATKALSPTTLYSPRGTDVLRAPLVYPEPWIYIRTGPRESQWPFRGRFAVVGPTTWKLGVGQAVSRFGIVAFALLAAASLLMGLFVHRFQREKSAPGVAAVAEPARVS